MARPKRTSAALAKAEQRAAGMQAIDYNLDLGNGLTLDNYNQKINYLRSQLARYTTALSDIDDLTHQITDLEADLNQTSEQMLLSVGGKYGKTSSEYGKAGGVRRGDRRRKAMKSAVATSAAEDLSVDSSSPIALAMNGKSTVSANGNGKSVVMQG
jgi:hypothetical protein